MTDRTPESLLAAAKGESPAEPVTPPSQPGAPSAANMAMEPEPEPEVEFDWIPVAQWKDPEIEPIRRDIRQITGLLEDLRGEPDAGRPDEFLFWKTEELLRSALAEHRLELCRKIFDIQGLPHPVKLNDLPSPERPA